MNLLRNPHPLAACGFAVVVAGVAVNQAMDFQIDGAPPGAACS